MTYKIIRAHNVETLEEEEVNKLIKEGWKPQGGILKNGYPLTFYNEIRYYQAMILPTQLERNK